MVVATRPAPIGETRHRLIGDNVVDSKESTATAIGAVTVKRHNAMAAIRFDTSDPDIFLDIVTNVDWPPENSNRPSVGVYINGAYHDKATCTAGATLQTFRVALPAGQKTVEVWEGSQHKEGGVVHGTYVYAVRARGHFSPVSPSRRLAVFGDSIVVGDEGTIGIKDGWLPLCRTTYPGRISVEAWGSRDLNGETVTTLAQRLVDLVAGATTREIWLAIGVVDYANSTMTAAAFETKYGQLLDEIRGRDTGVTIYCASPIVKTSEVANAHGNTLGDYRTAVSNATSGRSYATFVNGATIMTTGELAADGIHPNDTGHGLYRDRVRSVLNF